MSTVCREERMRLSEDLVPRFQDNDRTRHAGGRELGRRDSRNSWRNILD